MTLVISKKQQKQEAEGIIRASRFIRRYAKDSQKPINLDIIYKIHKNIFQNSQPKIAGKLRIENVKIRNSSHTPPHYKDLQTIMHTFNGDLQYKIKKICNAHLVIKKIIKTSNQKKRYIKARNEIIEMTAWAHHKIVWIHPFIEGNGRTTRLLANLILERHWLPGVSIEMKGENKKNYRKALKTIDKNNDYRALEEIIRRGIIDKFIEHKKEKEKSLRLKK